MVRLLHIESRQAIRNPRTVFLSTAFWLCAIFFLHAPFVQAQVSQYSFNAATAVYQAGNNPGNPTPANVFPLNWDDETATLNIPFDFYYNGNVYTTSGTLGVSANGWVAFSNGPISMTGTSAGGSFVSKLDATGLYLGGSANNQGIAVFNADIEEQVFANISGTIASGSNLVTAVSSFADIRIGTRLSGTGINDGTVVTAFDAGAGTITMSSQATASGSILITPRSSIYAFIRGTAPNREWVVQWTQVHRYNAASTESISFQLILHEAGGNAANQLIRVMMGDCSSSIAGSLQLQMGLRGLSSSDFHARAHGAGWSATAQASGNNEHILYSQSDLPLSGESFDWLPCTSIPAVAGSISGAASVCAGSMNTYILSPVAGATFYTWSFSGVGASFSATTSNPANTISFGTGATSGTLTVSAGNACGSSASSNLSITVNPLPSASISYPSTSYCISTVGPISVTQTGTGGGTYSSSPAGLTIHPTTGAITPSSSTPGSYIVQYSYNNGTCPNTTTFPVQIQAALSGTYTVGSGGHFATLTAAVQAYNNSCLSGPVVFELISANYSGSESYPIIIAKNNSASSVNSLRIKPAAGNTALIYGVLNDNALIRVHGDYVIIDGSNNGSQSRNLTIWNEGAVRPRVVLFGSSGTTPVHHDSLMNCIIRNGTTDAGAVVCSDASNIANPGYFHSIRIQNNIIRNSFYGIYCIAVNSGSNGNGLCIDDNDMSASGVDAIQFTGIFLQGVTGAKVRNNLLANFRGTDDASDNGIWLHTGVRNTQVTGNTIRNLNYTGTAGHGGRGIFISSGVTNTNLLIANNMIANLSGDGFNYNNVASGMNNPTGILLTSGPMSNIKIYNNSIYLGGVPGFTNTLNNSSAISVCIRFRGPDIQAEIVNNILVNRLGRVASLGLGSVGILTNAANASQFVQLDNNIYHIAGTGGGSNPFGMIGGGQYGSFAGWRTITGKDANSLNPGLPVFMSGEDLRLNPTGNNGIHNRGILLADIPDDIDGFTRHPQTPDIGCAEFVPAQTACWVGKVSVDWTDPKNWEANVVPSDSTDVRIDGGYTFLPTISGAQSVRGLNLLSPSTPPVLSLLPGSLLKINGILSYSGSARILADQATVQMNGTGAQSIPAGIFQDNKVLNLIVGNSSDEGLTLNGPLDVYRSLTFTSEGKRLNTGGHLVFKSTASGTAWLGDITGKIINGDATVERFIPTGLTHGKSWQFISVPVSGTQTVKQAWQEGNAPMGNLVPGYGTIITANIPGATALGFDVATPVASGPGMKVYNPVTNNWDGIANTSSLPIGNTKGYFVFVRGDRSVTTSTAPATPTILRAKGRLFTASSGEQPTATTILPDAFESIGNPYASAIDFEQISKPGPAFVDNTFYVWDPLLPGSQGLGGYQTISAVNGFKPVPGGTSTYPSDSVITRIESGQAFFMHATGPGSGGSISFSESSKIGESRLVHRGQGTSQALSNFRVQLYAGQGNDARLADAAVALFSSTYSREYDAFDALKLMNGGENLGISLKGKVVSVEARDEVRNADTIQLHMSNLRRQSYSLTWQANELPVAAFTAWLHDRYLNTVQPLQMNGNDQVVFEVNADQASAAANRFFIVFRESRPLPVTFITTSSIRQRDESVLVKWVVASEQSITHYEVEKSRDGRNFSGIGQVRATGSPLQQEYTFTDNRAGKERIFYRVRAVEVDGRGQYSGISSVQALTSESNISVYPNPVQGKRINLQTSLPEGRYQLRLVSAAGQVVYQSDIRILSGRQNQVIALPGHTAAGTYQLQLHASGHPSDIVQILIQ